MARRDAMITHLTAFLLGQRTILCTRHPRSPDKAFAPNFGGGSEPRYFVAVTTEAAAVGTLTADWMIDKNLVTATTSALST